LASVALVAPYVINLPSSTMDLLHPTPRLRLESIAPIKLSQHRSHVHFSRPANLRRQKGDKDDICTRISQRAERIVDDNGFNRILGRMNTKAARDSLSSRISCDVAQVASTRPSNCQRTYTLRPGQHEMVRTPTRTGESLTEAMVKEGFVSSCSQFLHQVQSL
jgi:hypothetical protein